MNYPAIDTTAVRWSVPRDEVARALAERPLLIMMHGYGSNEGDLFSLAGYLPEEFVVASVRAPNEAGPGFAWFHIDFDAENATLRRDIAEVNASTLSLIAWLDELEAEVGELARIALLGFSQGGVMMLQLMRYQPERFECGVLLAGFAAEDHSEPAAQRDAALAQIAPPVFWGRDPHDPVITPDLVDFTRRWLPAHTDLDARLYTGVGHGLSIEEVEDVREFLTNHVL